MESNSEEVVRQCCISEDESVVPFVKNIRRDNGKFLQYQYSKTWVKLNKKQLTIKDKETIMLGECLNDQHINFAQEI